MKINSFIVIQIFVISFLVISSCKNTEKDEKNTLDNQTKLESEIAPDSLQVKVDTIVAKDTARTEDKKLAYYGFHYKEESLSEIEYKLYGKVKRIVLNIYNEFTEVNGKFMPNYNSNTIWYLYYVNFKQDGRFSDSDMFRNSGGGYTYTYKKDSLNRPIEERQIFFDGDTTRIICTYNENNNSKTKTYLNFEDNSLLCKYIYLYDEIGNLSTLKCIDSEGQVSSKEQWFYDDKSNIISNSYYRYETGKLKSETHKYFYYIFDSLSNWTMQYKYDENNELLSITVRDITYY
jgi:hypothetical protein